MRRVLLAFALSIALLAAFVTVIGPATLTAQLARTNLPVFALGLLSTAGAVVVWSEGLRPLLAESGVAAPRWPITVAYAAAMLGRQVLPMGAVGGPAVTAYTVDREVELGYDETLAVVAVAEFLSTLASLTMAAVGVLFLLGELSATPQLRALVYGTAVFAVVLVGLGVVFLTERDLVGRALRAGTWALRATVGRVSTRMARGLAPPKTDAALGRFYATVDAVGANRRALAAAFGLHLAGWVLAAVPLYTSALALDASVSLPLVFLLVPTSGLVDILPLPGGLGGIEMVLATLLAAGTGMALALAAAVVVLYRLCSYWFLILLGAVATAYSASGSVPSRS